MLEGYVVHVTKQCNMKCLYCYEEDKTSIYTWDDVKKFIDDLVAYRTADRFTIEFLGGEPMLAWDLIEKAYEYIEIEYNNVVNVETYTITTNGTILDEKIANYLKNNEKFRFAISMEGTKWANQLRIMKKTNDNSYDVVMENIDMLQQYGINYNIHMVTHPYNIAFLEESIEHLYSKGIRSIGVGTIESTMIIDDSYCEEFIRQLDAVSKRIVSGEFKNLGISLFDEIKPREDIRSYIRGKDGKIIGESYGRSGNDVSKHDEIYTIYRHDKETETSRMIYHIRQAVYHNHQKNLLYNKERNNEFIR